MTTIPPWSYSALSCFENCPKQYYHRYILREKEPETEVAKHGTEVHKALEERLKDHVKKPLPIAYIPYEKMARSVEKAAEGGLLMIELPLALDKVFNPTGFFDKNVWGRGKADVVILKGKKLWTGDWKTGKVREVELKNQWQYWLNSTEYGKQLLAILQAQSVGGLYAPGGAGRAGFRC